MKNAWIYAAIITVIIIVAIIYIQKINKEKELDQRISEQQCKGDIWFQTNGKNPQAKVLVNKSGTFEEFAIGEGKRLLLKKSNTENYYISNNILSAQLPNGWKVKIRTDLIEEVCLLNTFGKQFINFN